MNTPSNKKTVIPSITVLSEEEQKDLRKTSRYIGYLVLFVVVMTFVAFGFLPKYTFYYFEYCIQWVLLLGFFYAAYGMGALLGCKVKLHDMGYVVNYVHSNYSGIKNQHSRSDDATHHRSSFHQTSMSINPSSGLPMSGSSGMDIRGNPSGSRSW